MAGNPGLPPERIEEALGALHFNEAGLIPAIAQDARGGTVLMMAWMNAEAVRETLRTGQVTYWSRSRGKLWRKGETSGNTQKIVEMQTDCDQDVIWMRVEQISGACHTGRRSCFYRSIPLGAETLEDVELNHSDAEKLFNPKDIYGQ